MKTTWLIIVIPVVFCGLSALQGCATQPTQPESGASTPQSPGATDLNADSNLSAEEQEIREQSSWFTASDAQGCAAGGVIGGTIGALAGGDERGIGAAIGLVLGCGVGIVVNKIFQSTRETFANQEDAKQELINKAKEENEKARQYIIAANQVIAADLNQVAAVEKILEMRQISLEQAKEELRRVDNNMVVMNKTLTGMKSREAQLREAAAKSPFPELDGEIIQYNGQITAYESELNRLVEKRVMTKIPSYENELVKSVGNEG